MSETYKIIYDMKPAKIAQTITSTDVDYQATIPDTDRYTADKYDLVLTMRDTVQGRSVSFHLNNTQLGVAAYLQYWHFDDTEKDIAQFTFNELKKASAKLIDEIIYERPPIAVIIPKFRTALHPIDPDHKEKSGIIHYNWYITEVEKAPDWRATIYGPRYPDKHISTMNENWVINLDEDGRAIEQEGDSPRNRITKYKYDTSEKFSFSFDKDMKNSYLVKQAGLSTLGDWLKTRWNNLRLPIFLTSAASATLLAQSILAQDFTQINKLEQAAQQYAIQSGEQISIPAPLTEQEIPPEIIQQSSALMTETQDAGGLRIEDWVDRVIQQESSGDPNAESPVGARGLMQIMRPTWDEWTEKLYGRVLPFDQAFDSDINKEVGTAYLKWVQTTLRNWMNKEPTIEQILAAYNGGIGRLRQNEYQVDRMPGESRDYSERITGAKPFQTERTPKSLVPPFDSTQRQVFNPKYPQASSNQYKVAFNISDALQMHPKSNDPRAGEVRAITKQVFTSLRLPWSDKVITLLLQSGIDRDMLGYANFCWNLFST